MTRDTRIHESFLWPVLATLGVSLVALLAYRQVFFPWGGLCGGDVISFHAPFLAGLKRAIQAGQPFPFWLNELCCGIPAIPDISATLLHPLYQLLRWFDVPTVIKLQILFNLQMLFWGHVLWLRSHHIEGKTTCFWALSSILFFPIQGLLSFGHLGIMSSIALLPWALLCVHTKDTSRPWVNSLQLGLVLGLAWVTGHPQLTLMLHEIAFLYLVLQWRGWQDMRRIFYFALACGLGLLLASPQLLPTAIHIFQSGRSESLNDAEFLNSGSLGFWQILRWFHPSIFGDEHHYWGQHSYWYGVLFSSPLLLILCVKGCAKLSRPALICLGVCFILALGAATPFYTLRQHIVPGANLFRYSSRFVYMAGPFILLALCHGGQAFLEAKKMRALAGSGLLVAMGVLLFNCCPQEWLGELLPEQVFQRRALVHSFSATSMMIVIQLGFVGVFVWVSAQKVQHIALAVVVLIQAHLWSQQQFANTQMLDWPTELAQAPQSRVITDVDDSPNLALTLGFESLTGYVGMTPKAYRNFLDTQTPQAYQKRNRLQCGGLSSQCLDMLGVGQRLKNGQFLERNALNTPNSHYYSFAQTLLPLSLRKDSVFSANLHAGQIDIGEKFRREFGHHFGDGTNGSADQPSVVLTYRIPERVVLTTRSPQPAILVGMENTHPFWQASIDGQPVDIHPWLGTFRSVFVPSGKHVVEFNINRTLFNYALAVSMATLCLMLSTLSWKKFR